MGLEQSISHKQCEPEQVAPKSQDRKPQLIGWAYLVEPSKKRMNLMNQL